MRTLLVAVLLSVSLAAQDSPRYWARYLSGHAGDAKPFLGGLIVTPDGVQILRVTQGWTHGTDAIAWTIPIAAIVDVTAEIRLEHHVGAFSWSTPSNHEYLTLTVETADTAEALVFELHGGAAAAVVAKIHYAQKHGVVP